MTARASLDPAAAPPVQLALNAKSRELEVDWGDGATSRYPYTLLRSHCRCAQCTADARRGVAAAEPPSTLLITGCELQGHYAIQLTFDDGHYRGIYPWAYLREIDPARVA